MPAPNYSAVPILVALTDSAGNAINPAPATPITAAAQDSTGAMKAPVYTFISHQLGVAVDTSTGLTVPAGTRFAIIQARAQAVRYRYDGVTTAPTATSGMTLPAGMELTADVGQAGLTPMRFIGAAAGAFLDVAYFS